MFNILAFSHVKVIVEPCQNALHDQLFYNGSRIKIIIYDKSDNVF